LSSGGGHLGLQDIIITGSHPGVLGPGEAVFPGSRSEPSQQAQ
jgi:hypothetical protein